MTGKERREQLLDIGRRLFAERGFEGTSIEEIAAKAGVSKPVVYEHFGGKEGLYAVVVDREVDRLLTMATVWLDGDDTMPKFENAAVGLLRYIEDNADGFRILVRDSPPGSGTGTFGTLLSDIAGQWWLDARKPELQDVAAHLINLAWNGLSNLDAQPRISPAVIAPHHDEKPVGQPGDGPASPSS